MIKYAKVTDPEKGLVEVGIGAPETVYQTVMDEGGTETVLYVSDFYKSLGMEEMEVEEGHDGNWYLPGFAPAAPETVQVRIFSKYKLCEAALAIPFTLADGSTTTVWEAFKSFITAAGKKDLWDNINEVAEDNRHFVEALPIAVENFGAELVEQILDAATERTETRTI